MSDSPFETAAKAALASWYAQFGKACTITRSGSSTTAVTMLPPGAGMQVLDSGGVRARSIGGEFICKKADYKIASVAVEPARGDTITDAGSRVHDVIDWEELIDTAEWRISVKEVDA